MKELSLLSPGLARVARVSSRLRLCEKCGVEDTMMTACRQCNKVTNSPPRHLTT